MFYPNVVRLYIYFFLSIVKIMDVDDINDEVQWDVKLRAINQELLLHKDNHPRYSLRKGILLYKNRMVIQKNSRHKVK